MSYLGLETVKPIKPMKRGDLYSFPVTTVDQIITDEDTNERLPEYLDKNFGMDLLWTNASPTSAFAAQTINVPEIKTATSVRIRFAAMTTGYTIHYADLVANKNDDNNYYYMTHVRYDSAFYAVWRDITVNWTDGTIVFGNGAQSNDGNNPIYMIPLDIAVISK